MASPPRPKDRSAFEIAIVCALRIESNAVEALFDKFWDEDDYGRAKSDNNEYTLGRISEHDVVLAYLSGMGKSAAASLASSLRSSFENVKLCLLVGICGGVPLDSEEQEILLGDVVISTGLVQYDFGRRYPDRMIPKNTVLDNLGRPPLELRNFLSKLSGTRSRELLQGNLAANLSDLLAKKQFRKSQYPGPEEDRLFKSTYRHKHHQATDCEVCAACIDKYDAPCDNALELSCAELECSSAEEIQRERLGEAREAAKNASATTDGSATSHGPEVHFGLVASGDQVMKSGQHRDEIAKQQKLIAFEMEAAGVWDMFPTVVIKGVCDYADSHKNKGWQRFAAASAAACTGAYLKAWKRSYRSDAPSIDRPLGTVANVAQYSEMRDPKFQNIKLISAISKGDLDGVHAAISNGCDLNSRARDGTSPLGLAVQKGESLIVYSILEYDVDLELAHRGSPPLCWAALGGYRALVEMLLDCGANINSRGNGEQTPLMMAVSRAHMDTVRLLLGRGSSISFSDGKGRTALHFAALSTGATVNGLIEPLLKCHANTEDRDASGKTPLMSSILTKELDVVSAVLKHSPSAINITDYEGTTPITKAIDMGLMHIALLLFKNGATIATLPEGGSLLHYTARQNERDSTTEILKQGIDVHQKDEKGCTALHVAASNGSLEVFRVLVAHGAQLEKQTPNGEWALSLALSGKHWHVVEELIEELARRSDATPYLARGPLLMTAERILETAKNAKLELVPYFRDIVRSSEDETALHIASAEGSKLFVRSLLALAVRIDAPTTTKNLTPLHYAAINGNLEVLKLLADAGADILTRANYQWTALHLAIIYMGIGPTMHFGLDGLGDADKLMKRGFSPANSDVIAETQGLATNMGPFLVAKWLISNNASSTANNSGNTPLHLVAVSRDVAASVVLIDMFASRGVNFEPRDKYSRTPLHASANKGKLDTIKALLKHGASCDAKDKDGNTPLHLAQRRYDYWADAETPEIVKALVTREAAVDARNANGATPLLLRCERRDPNPKNTLSQLLESWANANIADNRGTTPLHASAKLGRITELTILLDYGADINARNADGESAMHLAASAGYEDTVAFLLKRSADVSIETRDGRLPVDVASKEEIKDMLRNRADSSQRRKKSGKDKKKLIALALRTL